MFVLPGLIGNTQRNVFDKTPAGASTTTWNPADKDSEVTLSGGNLIASGTASTSYDSVRAIASASSGKKYWEITCDASGYVTNNVLGVGNSTANLDSYVGSDGNSFGHSGGGTAFGITGDVNTYTTGDVVCFALDMDNSRYWRRTGAGNWNNNGSADPATNTGGLTVTVAGPFFPMINLNSDPDQFTANFGGSAYAQTPPSGFGNW